MAAAVSPVPPALCKRGLQQLVLVHAAKPPLPLVSRRHVSVSVRAAPPRQHQHQQSRARPRPPPRNKRRVDPSPNPRPAHRPPRGSPLDPDYDDDGGYDQEEGYDEGRFAGGTRAAAMPKPPAGFVLDDKGRCIAAASKRIVTIVRLLLLVCHARIQELFLYRFITNPTLTHCRSTTPTSAPWSA